MIEILAVAAWWLIGFIAALGAWFFLHDCPSARSKYGMPRNPLTNGAVIGCALSGWLAPLAVVMCVISSIFWLADLCKAKGGGRIRRWLQRPIFRS